MDIPVLAVKTSLPRPLPRRVERSRLRERLDKALLNQGSPALRLVIPRLAG
jgi:hypothetical protein